MDYIFLIMGSLVGLVMLVETLGALLDVVKMTLAQWFECIVGFVLFAAVIAIVYLVLH